MTGLQLPVQPEAGGKVARGFATNARDTTPQRMAVLPKEVIPIIFLPGVMGTNLRLTVASNRQTQIGASDNVAWRPDQFGYTHLVNDYNAGHLTPRQRQQLLDPDATEVDTYDAGAAPTGNPNESANKRNSSVHVTFDAVPVKDSPLIADDPPGVASPRKTKDQKARERGWGEVHSGSYSEVLQLCEQALNSAYTQGMLGSQWRNVVGVKPEAWLPEPPGAHNVLAPPPKPAGPVLPPLTESDIKQATQGCWFPVHAVGYNWLESNEDSSKAVAKRVTKLMADYKAKGYICEKVIVVTHSMGGLVARALIHPEMGNFRDKVLGMIHGVMPAIGAGTAYKRIRAGFEGTAASASVPGNFGDEVTAVLANSQGGLELLPTQAYGNGWLQVKHKGGALKSLPARGDPYEEIYKLRGKWYGLLREEWLNPAGAPGGGYTRTARYIDSAKKFHNAIANTYHDVSYAHYGVDPAHLAWRSVVWQIDSLATVPDVDDLALSSDNRQGKVALTGPGASTAQLRRPAESLVHATMSPADEPGDSTVPRFSADAQLRSGQFKAVFPQVGYGHQSSYTDDAVLASTLYSLIRIAQRR